MKKLFTTLLLIYGSLLVLSGVLKLLGALEAVKVNIAGYYLNINNPTGPVFIVLLNFLGGASLIYFALQTRGYAKYLPPDPDMLDEQKPAHNTRELSGLTLFTGLWSALVGLWMLFRGISMMSAFDDFIAGYIPLVVFVLVYYIPFGLIPLISVYMGFSIHNDIKKRNETLAFHARKQKKA